MFYMDYNIEQFGDDFIIHGDWPGEIMGVDKDGNVVKHGLYKPGDVFEVQPNGMLKKVQDGRNKSTS
jgi:hypothetical protein